MSRTKTARSARQYDYENDIENISSKQRFGLFSQPKTLAIGDKFEKRSQSNGPEKNIYTNPNIRTIVNPPLFEQQPPYVTLEDPYKEPFKIKQHQDKVRAENIPHLNPFRNPDSKKTKNNFSNYEHMKDYEIYKSDKRGPDGKIMIAPRNFYTENAKRGYGNTTVGHLFENMKYENADYNRPKELQFIERANAKGKILDATKPFCSTQKKNNFFENDQNTFGFDRDAFLKENSFANKYKYPGGIHSCAFKLQHPPASGVVNKTFSNLQYIEEGQFPKKLKKKQTIHQTPWRPNSQGTSVRPTPSLNQKLSYTQYGKFGK